MTLIIRHIILLTCVVIFSFAQRRVPAEWEYQEAIWLQWPNQFEHWMRPEMAEVISVIQDYEPVHVIVQNNNQLNQAQNQMLSQGGSLENVTFHIQVHENAWLRDNGPIWIEDSGQMIIQNMQFDGWGGLVNEFDDDNDIPCIMADWLEISCENLDFIMERGNLEFNGDGTLITNWDCWNDRNPTLNQEYLESILLEVFSLDQIVWTYGHSPYDVTAGHIDGVVRFVDENTVAVSRTLDQNDPDAWIGDSATVVLENAGFEVVFIDMPGYVNYYSWELPAIYVNWLVINGAVIGNAYGVESWDNTARDQIQALYPNHEVILIETFEVNLSGGGVHCITNDQPALSGLIGDINQDDVVNIQDIVLAVNIILDADYLLTADLNLDGAVNVVDIILLVNVILDY